MQTHELTEKTASWEQFYQMIHVQFPHSQVTNMQVRDGEVLFPEHIDHTFPLSREEAREDRAAPEVWDARWLRLLRFCRKLRNIDFRAIHFRDGIPQFVDARTYFARMENGAPTPIRAAPALRRMAVIA